MPTVMRLRGRLRLVVYPNDHRPAHVHVTDGPRVAVFELNCPGGPPGLRESRGFAAHELNAMARSLHEGVAALCAAWETIHGTP